MCGNGGGGCVVVVIFGVSLIKEDCSKVLVGDSSLCREKAGNKKLKKKDKEKKNSSTLDVDATHCICVSQAHVRGVARMLRAVSAHHPVAKKKRLRSRTKVGT